MQKLLFIAPHLSTGGLPQYLTKKIELLKDEFDIYLVEWVDCTGGVLVVTRNKILKLVEPNKFFTLGENKMELIDIINSIQPDIIHTEEIPEFYMDDEVASKIYKTDRNYIIIETSHDSSFNTNNKKFLPDKFMFVSQWQIEQYKNINIPSVLVEYPIEYTNRPNREEALRKLQLDPAKKHILHVGLYTSRKNQAEFFEYARSMPEYEFHSLGNRADNFKWYWEPLANDTPLNLTWWNERTDVDAFYQAMDLFLFTSRGHENDKETMPLVIREAISYQIPTLIYNLEVYQNYFNKFPTINYLEFDNFEQNLHKIKNILNPEEKLIDYSKEAFVVCTYPVTDAIIQTTKDCINSLKKYGRKIIISAHAPVPQELQEMVDYVIYDANNFLVKHTFYANYWCYNDLYDTWVDLRGEDNDRYHGGVCYTSFYNGAILGKYFNHEKLYFVNYDYVLKDESYIDYISKILDKKDTYFGFNTAFEGNCFITYFFAAKASVMLDRLKEIKNEQDYTQCMIDCGSESNGIENIYYHLWKDYPNNYVESKEQFTENIEKYFHFEDFSMVEYYTILPTNLPNYFCPWIQISNNKESKTIIYTVEKNGIEIINRDLFVYGKYQFWDMIKYNLNDDFIVTFKIYDSITNNFINTYKFELNKDYFENKIKNNGLFTWKGDLNYLNNPKIKLMHLVTEPDSNPKEIRSIESVFDFCEKMDIKYEQRINKIWKELPPKDTCNRPNDVQDVPGYYKLAPGHYGCFKAHTDAIIAEDNKDYDYVLIFEGDVIIDSDYQELYDSLKRFSKIARENNQDIIGFGNPFNNRNLNGPKIEDIYTDVTPFIPAQSYLINQDKMDYVQNKVRTTKWDAFDMWVCNVAQLKVGTAEKIYTKHLPGFSIIEQEFKGMDENSPEIYATE